MSRVEIRERQISVDGEPIPLLSGEIHYWRLDPAAWRDVVRAAKEMGLRVIAPVDPK